VEQPKVYEAAGAKLQVAVMLDQPTIMVGEPAFFRFRVNNTSNLNLRMMVGSDYRNRLGRPETFKIDVVDSEGRKVSQPDAGATMGGIGGPAKLPANGHYDFSLFLPHWATFKEPGTYMITCRRKLELLPDGGDDPVNPKTDKVETVAKATITVVPADHKKFGELIAKLGAQMLERNVEGWEQAEKMLTAIHDERVVPYFVKLAQKPHQSPRMAACGPLGRYKSDEAFAALKKLMTTTAADVRHGSTTWELAESSADAVHHYAIHAIAESPHPEALRFLWTQAGDRYYGVRLTILHKAAEVKTPEARAIINMMTQDVNETVRKEAVRYRGMLAK